MKQLFEYLVNKSSDLKDSGGIDSNSWKQVMCYDDDRNEYFLIVHYRDFNELIEKIKADQDLDEKEWLLTHIHQLSNGTITSKSFIYIIHNVDGFHAAWDYDKPASLRWIKQQEAIVVLNNIDWFKFKDYIQQI